MKRLTPFLCAILGALFGALLVQSPTLQAGDNFSADRVQLNSPASIFRTITPNDSVELTDIPRAVWVGGAGDVVAIGAGDGAKQSGASAANATTLTAYGSLPAYSSGTPGQYVICGDGTHAAEIISGYMATANVITVTTGGGTGGNKTANAHNDQTLIGAYAPFKSASAGGFLPIRPRIILTSGVGTTATNFTGAF